MFGVYGVCVWVRCYGVCGYGVQALGVRMVIVCMCRVVYVVCTLCVYGVCIVL